MANLNINIINPTISLISRPSTSSTKCESTFEFTIKSTPNASITIAATLPKDILNNDDLRELSYNLGSGFNLVTTQINNSANYPFITDTYIKKKDIVLNNTGEAKVRIVLSNSEQSGVYYTTKFYIKDNTNNKEETKEFTRYDDSIKCRVGLEPIAISDGFTVIKGTQSSIDILKNDERLHYIPDFNVVTILTQPLHGTAVFEFGTVKYIHNGNNATSDVFLYNVETPNGLSNTAIVDIVIDQDVQTIDNETYVFIGFDSSGSMDETLPILNAMITNELYTKLRPYYNSDTDYNEKVKVISFNTERFLEFTKDRINQNPNKKIVTLIFQNEAAFSVPSQPSYETDNVNDPRRPAFVQDLDNIRTKLSDPNVIFNSVLFQVVSGDDPQWFKRWLEWVENGEGVYSGNNGFSNIPNIRISYDVKGNLAQGASGQYYTDLIVTELNSLGFNIT